MRHYGDITKIDGRKVPLVDIVCGGSPCQDLSVAGKRNGLQGERSGLYMEQIRVIKEMRDESAKQLRVRGATFDRRLVQPRYMLWENVPGALSSGKPKGEDFRIVLEEAAKVADENATIPKPEGGWTNSGFIVGNGWSIAYRVLDAQYHGVPQRRRRICLVCDFNGETAGDIVFEIWRETTKSDSDKTVADFGSSPEPQIQFESKGLSGNIEQSKQERERTSCNTGESSDTSGIDTIVLEGHGSRPSHNGDGFSESNISYTLNSTEQHGVCYGLDRASFNQGINAKYDFSVEEELAPTLVAKGPGG